MWYFSLSQFSPCRKVIFDEKVFSAGREGFFPLRENCGCYDVLFPSFVSYILYVGRQVKHEKTITHRNITSKITTHQADSIPTTLLLHNTYAYFVYLSICFLSFFWSSGRSHLSGCTLIQVRILAFFMFISHFYVQLHP